jgi:hypothetical protein
MLSMVTHHDDVELELELIRHAHLLADPQNSVGEAVAELRLMANGRKDLLGSAADAQVGAYLASPRTMEPYLLLAGTLLTLAAAEDSGGVKDVGAARRRKRVWGRRMAPGAA